MSKTIIAAALALLSTVAVNSHASQQMACKAVLCLAAGSAPSECRDALKAFYDIKVYKHGILDIRKTINAREAFLSMCPMEEYNFLAGAFAKGQTYCDGAKMAEQYNFGANGLAQGGGDFDHAWRMDMQQAITRYNECSPLIELYQKVNADLGLPEKLQVCGDMGRDNGYGDWQYKWSKEKGDYVRITREVCVERWGRTDDLAALCNAGKAGLLHSNREKFDEKLIVESIRIPATGQVCF